MTAGPVDSQRTRGLAGCVVNAAKEFALDMFIAGRIGFMDMAGLIKTVLTGLAGEPGLTRAANDLSDVKEMDHLARIRAVEAVQGGGIWRR